MSARRRIKSAFPNIPYDSAFEDLYLACLSASR